MKKKIIYTLLFFLAIIFQTSVLPVVCKSYSLGDFVLMLVLAGAIIDGFWGFFAWAIFAGIFYDLASYEVIGVHSLIFLLTTYFVSFFSRRLSVEFKGVGIVLFLFFVFVASFFSRAIIFLVTISDFGEYANYFSLLFGNLGFFVVQLISNAFIFLILFFAFKKIKSFFDIE